MAGENYAFSIPKTDGSAILYFLPTGNETVSINAHFIQEYQNEKFTLTLTVSFLSSKY